MVRSSLALLSLILLVAGLPASAVGEEASLIGASSAVPVAVASDQPIAVGDEEEDSDDDSAKRKSKEEEDDDAKESDDANSESDEDSEAKPSKESKSKDDEQADDEDADEEESSESKKPKSAKSKDAESPDSQAKDEKKSSADEKSDESSAKKPDKAEPKKAETYKVKAKKLKIEVEADGVFVAEKSSEVALRPEVWTSFKVVEAVPHGKRVRKGDVLVKFDDKDIEKSIAEKSLELRTGELDLMAAEEEFPRNEKSILLNYEQAKRDYDEAVDEKKRFEETMRDLSERMASYYLDSSKQQFENANEELQQLQKMYEADELTEETEEIVLKRQKFQVEAAKFFLEYAKINHQFTTEISIPRREESLKTAVEAAKIAFERANMAKSLGANQQRYQLEKMREARAKAVDNHAKLLADRALMTLKAPADGIAYYGRSVNGRWIEVSGLESKLIPFGTLTPNSVVMTVVEDRPMYVETTIGEKELPTVHAKQPAVVVPVADDKVELKGAVVRVADVPGAGNRFPVRVDLKSDDAPAWLMPGMTCKTKITVYDVPEAIVIPADLLQSDEDEAKEKYVMLQAEGKEKPVRRDVTVGKTKEKEVEIVKGLKAGDLIVKGAKVETKD